MTILRGAINKALKVALNFYIRKYGKMIDLKVDHKNKNIIASVLLNGEREAIEIKIDDYEIIKKDKTELKINKASANRPWVEALLENFVVGTSKPMPDKIAKVLDKLLG